MQSGGFDLLAKDEATAQLAEFTVAGGDVSGILSNDAFVTASGGIIRDHPIAIAIPALPACRVVPPVCDWCGP